MDAAFRAYPFSFFSHRKIFFTWLTIIVFVIVDTFLSNVIQNLTPIGTDIALVLFIIIACILTFGQFFVLHFVKQQSKHVTARNDLHLKLIFRTVSISQCILVGVLLFVILQMTVMSYYNVSLLMAGLIISYGLAILMLGLLARRFFIWFRAKKGATVLLYGLSSGALAINATLTILDVGVVLQGTPAQVESGRQSLNNQGIMNFSPLGQVIGTIDTALTISSIVSFILTWIATCSLLHHYSKKLGKLKYWTIMVLPAGYFLIQFIVLYLNLFATLLQGNPVFYSVLLTLIFTLSRVTGGILFGVAFWTMARSIRQTSVVREYVIIAGYGFVLLFISNQAGVLAAVTYPPFGLPTIIFMGMSSYLLLVGIYSSSISVAEDSKLRQSIRNYAVKESRLIDSIGTAEMQREIEKKVIEITKRNQERLVEESGIQTSITEDDMKAYLHQVMMEIQETRRHNNEHEK